MNRSHAHTSNHLHHRMDHHHHHQPPTTTAGREPIVDTVTHANQHTTHDYAMMQMSFHAGFVETILFEQWLTTNVPVFILSWILVFILGLLHEGVKEIRLQWEEEQKPAQQQLTSQARNEEKGKENELELLNTGSSKSKAKPANQQPSKYLQRTLLSILYAVQLTLSYLLMLIAMTFNIYLFMAILFGVGTGHLLCSSTRSPATHR